MPRGRRVRRRNRVKFIHRRQLFTHLGDETGRLEDLDVAAEAEQPAFDFLSRAQPEFNDEAAVALARCRLAGMPLFLADVLGDGRMEAHADLRLLAVRTAIDAE